MVYITTTKLKSALFAYKKICMAILYRTAKFKSANILAIVILGSTAKFNSRQYIFPAIRYIIQCTCRQVSVAIHIRRL